MAWRFLPARRRRAARPGPIVPQAGTPAKRDKRGSAPDRDNIVDARAKPRLCADDARSTMVCLLPAGRAAIEKAAPRHVEDVRRNFIEVLTPAELDTLAALNERIQRHLATHHDSCDEDELS